MSKSKSKLNLKSTSPIATAAAFAAVISLVACAPHKTSYKPKAGDAKTTNVGGAVTGGAGASGLSITNPTRQLVRSEGTGTYDIVESTFTISDGGAQVLLDVYWKIGSTNKVTKTANGGTYTVETKCANDECTQFAALFTIQSANPANPGSIRVADLYEDFGPSQGGVLIVKDVSYCSWTTIDDALNGLQDLADQDWV